MSEPQHRLFERFACALILGLPEQWTLEFESPDELRCKTSAMRVLLLRWKPENAATFSAALKPQLKALAALDILEVVLLGGGDEAKRALKQAAPLFTTHKVLLHHVGDTNTWRSARAIGSVVGAAFDQASKGDLPEIDATTAAAVETALTNRRAALVADVNEVNAFAATMQARTPWATYTLLAVIAAVFAAEWILGGDTTNAYLMRFGALYAPRVRDGELWRLLSCSFLHAGPLHFLLNSYVLYLLGSSVERLVGSARFLCLYWAAAIGGSVASTLLLGTVPSVGASGAIWGLLAAEGVLAYRPQGMFPASFAAQMKKAALTNLAINVAISFRPGVDWGAHLGGGLVGALLMGSGVLVMGLVKLSEVEGVGTDAVRPPPITPSLPARIGAAILTIAAGSSLVAAIALGRPWLLDAPLVLERRTLAGSDLSLELPKDFAREKVVPLEAGMPPAALYYQLGDLATDPCTVFVYRAPFSPAVQGDAFEAVMQTMMKELRADPLPENWAVVTAPERIAIGGRQSGVYTKRRFKEESTFERTLRLREGDLLRIETVAPTRFDATCSGLATRIAASAEELTNGGP